MNISDYVIDYLEAFVVSEQLTGEDVLLFKREYDQYLLYVNRICNFKVQKLDGFCTLYLKCSEDGANVFEKMIYRKCQYGKRYTTIYNGNGYVTDVTYEFSLYKEKKVSQVLEVILNFIKERAQSD